MKHLPPDFQHFYKEALRAHLTQGSRADPAVINVIAGRFKSIGLSVLELAKFHEHVLVMDLLLEHVAGKQAPLIRKAGMFFSAAVTTADARTGVRVTAYLRKMIESLSGRGVQLAAANRLLGLKIIQNEKMEYELRRSERDGLKALDKCEALKEHLRGLSQQMLSVQEEERKTISHELHDVISQSLLGINVRLAALKREAEINTRGLDRNISLAQKIITKSADAVHQFARELHPAALDDLGLIPTLHSVMKNFTTRTGIRTQLTVFEGVEALDKVELTVLYRIAQAALAIVARHAQASHVEVNIRKDDRFVRMEVSDDGNSFQDQPALPAHKTRRPGPMGVREHVEMVGGCFDIVSAPGKDHQIIARVPISKTTGKNWRKNSAEKPT